MTPDTTTHVGSRLRALRDEAGLTQLQVAIRADLSPQQVSNYERGQGMRLKTAVALARALDVSLDKLVGEG